MTEPGQESGPDLDSAGESEWLVPLNPSHLKEEGSRGRVAEAASVEEDLTVATANQATHSGCYLWGFLANPSARQ